MRLGICVTNFAWPAPTDAIGPTVAGIARAADEAGFDSLWTFDHFFQIPINGGLPPESPMLETYATLGFLAAVTERIQLGTCVGSVAYRHPGVLIKTVTTLDVLSGGRIVFGIGAGSPWTKLAIEHEAGGLGIPFPSLHERFERLEEALQIAHQMWRGDDGPFDGIHYQLTRTLNSPNSIQRPHPPILIGGSGEEKTLRLVAQYGDACNLFDLPSVGFQDDLAHKLDVLRKHCDDVGRDYDDIEKTTSTLLDLGADREAGLEVLRSHLRDLAATGIDHVLLSPGQPWDPDTLAAVATLLPDLHAIPRTPALNSSRTSTTRGARP